MTRAELCHALQAPDDTPAGDLLASWQQRRSELGAALASEASPKPVKLRLRGEMQRLAAAEPIAAQLQVAAEFERYYAEYLAEQSKHQPARGVLALCLTKAQSVVPHITDPELRFRCEKTLAAGSSPAAPLAGPAAPAPPAVAHEVLELRPVDSDESRLNRELAIRLIARPRFTLGRQSAADFVARFLPETPENLQKTSTISRVNTTLFLSNHQVWVQDGQGGEGGAPRPSRNGTFLDEVPISHPLPLNVSEEQRLRLGQFGFEVKVHPFAGDRAAEAPAGCLGFEAAGKRQRGSGSDPFDARILWMISDVLIGSGPSAAIRLPPAAPPAAARILHSNGIFQLQILPAASALVAIDGQPCEPGTLLRLNDDQDLTIHHQRFKLRLT
jgi:hypothetical protein